MAPAPEVPPPPVPKGTWAWISNFIRDAPDWVKFGFPIALISFGVGSVYYVFFIDRAQKTVEEAIFKKNVELDGRLTKLESTTNTITQQVAKLEGTVARVDNSVQEMKLLLVDNLNKYTQEVNTVKLDIGEKSSTAVKEASLASQRVSEIALRTLEAVNKPHSTPNPALSVSPSKGEEDK